jgi:hypothetical protein
MRGVWLLSTSLAVALGGCTSAPRAPVESTGTSTPPRNPAYERALASWVDRAEEDLVAAWGVPERSQRLTDGGQVFEYRRIGADGRLLCSTLFTSDIYGQIRTWTYRGTDCRQPQLGDYGNRS